jgi:hypothetical protein
MERASPRPRDEADLEGLSAADPALGGIASSRSVVPEAHSLS